MNKILLILFLLVPAFASLQSAGEFIIKKPAYPRMYNDDNAYAYYHKDWRRLEDKLINHYKRTGNQLVFIITPSLHGISIEEAAVQTFRNWGIGDKESNSGLLVLIARNENKIKIETGYGLEGQVTDLACGAIIRDILEPGLSKYNFQLPPATIGKSYLPTIEKVMDTLIYLTEKTNEKAVHNIAVQKKNSINAKRTSLVIYIVAAIAFLIVAKAGWKLLNRKLSSK